MDAFGKSIFNELFLYDIPKKYLEIAENYKLSESEVSKLRKEFIESRCEEIETIKRIRSVFNNKKRNKKIREKASWEFDSFKSFYDWYVTQHKKQGGRCYYCKTSEDIVDKIAAERSSLYPRRGKSLEVERRNSKKGENKYNEVNCVLCCYFCNNAKSDLFEEEEFMPINKGIADAIKIIMAKDNDSFL